MHIIDISWPISEEMTEYKTKKEVLFTQTKRLDLDGVEEHLIQLGAHTGTHIDAPAHFVPGGSYSDSIPLDACIGPCTVIDATDVEHKISADFLEKQNILNKKRILFKTKNSELDPRAPFNPDFIALNPSAAQWLVDQEVELVGIDYLGIERSDPTHQTHLTLLSNNVLILEGIRLQSVVPGLYELICLPLAFRGLEAAPARAILTK
ncbi:cyclase family protein [Candidatus Babeliales bacterium]|nr:cyclase family protein [Candidatus Babeliales bacterium]